MRTLGEILADHLSGARSPSQTIAQTYAAIRAHDDPALFISLKTEAAALAEAAALEAAGSSGKPLYGVPVAVKDNIDVAGLPTTAACPAFTFMPTASATAVQRLTDAGAIVIGKTNLDQFATGLVGVRSPYGVPRNALDASLIPSGSSSGRASRTRLRGTPRSPRQRPPPCRPRPAGARCWRWWRPRPRPASSSVWCC